MDTEVVTVELTDGAPVVAERPIKKLKAHGRRRFADQAAAKRVIEGQKGKVGVKSIDIERPGLTALAAIDFLVNYHGYTWAGRVDRMIAVASWAPS